MIAHMQLPSTADVCLLAGVICVHDWLRRIWLDGNPIDEEGLGFLCRALLRNGSVQSLSLKRCGLGERSGLLLLHMVAEKPGLEVDASEGNNFGEEIESKVTTTVLHNYSPPPPQVRQSPRLRRCARSMTIFVLSRHDSSADET